MKAVGTAIAGGIASGAAGAIVSDLLNKRSLTAIENFFGNLFNKCVPFPALARTLVLNSPQAL